MTIEMKKKNGSLAKYKLGKKFKFRKKKFFREKANFNNTIYY